MRDRLGSQPLVTRCVAALSRCSDALCTLLELKIRRDRQRGPICTIRGRVAVSVDPAMYALNFRSGQRRTCFSTC